MNKYIAPILTIAIVASLAGVLYIRANVDGSIPKGTTADTAPTDGTGPTVVWSVTPADGGDGAAYSYDLATKQADGPRATFEGPGIVRFNQSTDLCRSAYAVAKLAFDCTVDERSVLTMNVADETDNGRDLGTFVVDPRALGAVEGYLVPVAVSDDKSTIYLGRRIESESWVAGLWKLDVGTGKASEVSFVRTKQIYQYDINPVTKQLLGVAFTPPEGLGELPGGPAATYLVDLATGTGRILTPADASVSENPFLSDDATMYSTKWVSANNTFVNSLNPLTTVATIDGVAKDWFGDTLVFDRGGNLFLYDLKTKTETQLTHETDATVEYLGVVK